MNKHHFEIMEEDHVSTDTTSDEFMLNIAIFRFHIELIHDGTLAFR